VRRLDTIWPELAADPSTVLLKTDTQGHDLEVIDGAGDLLQEIPVLLMEVAVVPLYQDAPDFPRVVETLWGRGFELTGAFPVHRYGRARVSEFDCTFVNVRRLQDA
jgi:hypothetical protein